MIYSSSDLERFWNKVDICTHGLICSACCWEWNAHRGAGGYGKIMMHGEVGYASRVAWEIKHHQKIPTGLYALHHCDNPPCCNHHHIYLGTKARNALDAKERGRVFHGTGTLNGRAILTEEDVREIRFLYSTGKYSYTRLSNIYPVSKPTIAHIITYKLWKHV